MTRSGTPKMPALHPSYPYPICKRIHALYLTFGEVPKLNGRLYFHCPVGSASSPVTEADGWRTTDVNPTGALEVFDGGHNFSHRACS